MKPSVVREGGVYLHTCAYGFSHLYQRTDFLEDSNAVFSREFQVLSSRWLRITANKKLRNRMMLIAKKK